MTDEYWKSEPMELDEAIAAAYGVITTWGPTSTYTDVYNKIMDMQPGLKTYCTPTQGCVNYGLTPDGQKVAMCFVGQIYAATRSLVDIYDSDSVSEISERHPDLFTEKALLFLDTIQTAQDSGTPWGEAFYVGLTAVGIEHWKYQF